VLFIGISYVYQHLVYYVFFCHHNAETCEHPALEEPIIRRLFYSLLTLGSPYLAVQLCRIVAVFIIFVSNRSRDIENVINLESKMAMFTNEMDSTFSEAVVAKYRNVRTFLEAWLRKNDEDISVHLREKARAMMTTMISACEEYPVETAEADELSYSRFVTYLHRACGIEDDKKARSLWGVLVSHEQKISGENETDQDATQKILTCGGLEDMLYELFFRRKELIHAIYTDHHVISYLANVALALLTPASFIAVARVWGYQNSFGNGVDLFKTYMLAASYILTSFKDNIAFLVSMLTDRPFNLGDILALAGETYKVRRFSLTHFYLDGPHYASVPNTRFSSSVTVNITKHGITDSLRVTVPLSTSPSRINRARIYEIMHAYQQRNQRDINRDSIRCGWADAPDGASKVMQVSWRYNFRIFDRSRLNWARADVRDHIMRSLETDMRNAHFATHIAGGGGYNEAFSGVDPISS